VSLNEILSLQAFDEQTRWTVEYLGITFEDARKVNGVWYARQNGSFIHFDLQHAVRVRYDQPRSPEHQE